MPPIDDYISSKKESFNIRNINIEDLLGRDVVNLDVSGVDNLILNKTVMVSGAGGSIGSELCRQILKFKPSLLICFDSSEHSLYALEQSVILNTKKTKILYLIGDAKNDIKLHDLFSSYKPNLVFHAAAYKHVPLMERQNVKEAINNNVLGTYSLGKACIKFGAEKFILISTDKAVNSTNVMGASKRLAEMVCHKLQGKTGTKFSIVRFGNVLGSSGSVIPKFREQIAKGGPITVTHPEISRYFMSIPEACQLILQASVLSDKGKETFILDMGEQIKILSLAKKMILLSGLSENEIHIKFSGLRPGEKLFEELVANNEKCKPTKHQKIQLIESINSNNKNIDQLISWIKTIQKLNETTIKKELINWVVDYRPDLSVDTGVDND
jgi:FlaA1/EpsC-like NDP-sugar epimerase